MKQHRPVIGILVDGFFSYGRSILRGVVKYSNLRRRWLLYENYLRSPQHNDIRRYWPDCDGAIVGGSELRDLDFVRSRCPHVISCSGHTPPELVPVVAMDDVAAGALAAEHLLECRLRHFAYYGRVEGHVVSQRRRQGFKAVIESRGCVFSDIGAPFPRPSDYLTHAHHPALIERLKMLPKPVGIMAFDDFVAHDLANACYRANIAVPDQVAIIGVNNDDLLCDTAWPALSSVNADYSRMGFHAAKLLDRLLSGETLLPEERAKYFPPAGVVRRQSTDTLAISDPDLAAAIRFIREHACDPCQVGDVLCHVPVARRWLERQFSAQLGHTVHDEITMVKIRAAQQMLTSSDLSLEEISHNCGFATLPGFGRAFLRITGTSPAAFRKSTTLKSNIQAS